MRGFAASTSAFACATISNDNLQDLKTGQLVGATPWKQQVALVIGVLFGSAVIPPILGLMYDAFGFVGAPGETKDSLAAPQAGLLKDLTQGVLGGDLDVEEGAAGAAVVDVVVDQAGVAQAQHRMHGGWKS